MSQNEKIKQILTNELKGIEKLKKRVERSLKKAPEGNLVVSKSNGVTQYFHKTEKEQKKGKYIAKKNSKLIAALAQKEYDITFLKELEKQEAMLKRSTREEIFLEYFGMMEDQEYCKKAVERIQELARNGLILGKNFFAIFESKDTPLDSNLVEKMLMEFV